MNDTDTVDVKPSRAEALVLFELLSRTSEAPEAGRFAHPSERRVLDDILCVLEESLEEPFAPDWPELLRRAREQVTGGGWP